MTIADAVRARLARILNEHEASSLHYFELVKDLKTLLADLDDAIEMDSAMDLEKPQRPAPVFKRDGMVLRHIGTVSGRVKP